MCCHIHTHTYSHMIRIHMYYTHVHVRVCIVGTSLGEVSRDLRSLWEPRCPDPRCNRKRDPVGVGRRELREARQGGPDELLCAREHWGLQRRWDLPAGVWGSVFCDVDERWKSLLVVRMYCTCTVVRTCTYVCTFIVRTCVDYFYLTD